MPDFWMKQSGTWRKAKQLMYRHSGTWRTLKQVWYNDNGTWRLVFEPSGVTLAGFPDTINSGGFGSAATALYTIRNDGTHSRQYSGNTETLSPDWLSGGNASDYDVMFQVQSGDSFLHVSSAARDVWHNLANTWELLTFGSSTVGVTQETVFRVRIRDANSLVVLATSDYITMSTRRIF